MAEEKRPPDELTIVFKKPIVLADTHYTDITLREPTVGEMEKAGEFSGVGELIELTRVIAAVPQGVVRQIPISQFREIAAYFRFFTQGGPWSGARA